MRKAAVITSIVALLLGLGTVAFALNYHQSASPNSKTPGPLPATTLRVGGVVPTAFVLQRVGGGQSLDLAELVRGHDAVINVFASWCPACGAELHAFAAESRAEAGKVVFVGIDTNEDDLAKSLQLLHGAQVTYPVGLDSANLGVASAFGIENLPTTLYLNRAGHLVSSVLGGETSAQLRSEIAKLH